MVSRSEPHLQTGGHARELDAELSIPPGLTVLSLRMAAGQGGDPFRRWAVDGCASLLEALQRLIGDSTSPMSVVILVACDATGDPWEHAAMEAGLEAVRGAVHSLTPELGAAARLNVVVRRLGGDDEAVVAALEYIASPGGAYVAGSTLDLRQSS